MSKSSLNQSYKIRVMQYAPPSFVLVALALFGGLAEPVFKSFGMKNTGSMIVLYAILSVATCTWLSLKIKGVSRVIALICILPLVLFGLWGYVIIRFSSYQF